MKCLYLVLISLLIHSCVLGQGFIVKNYTADIYLHAEGYFDVIENYDVEFSAFKHGIYRDIITKFDFKDENGVVSKREIYISNLEVPGEKFKTNEIFGKQLGDKINIRIGDKNKMAESNKHYEIRYRVKNALIFTNDEVMFYWNIKTSEWLTIFKSINFTIHTPERASLSPGNCFVYSGNTGNTEPSKEFDYNYSDNSFSGNSKENFISVPGQNVTILVKLPKSLIQEMNYTPPFWKRYSLIGLVGLFLLAIFAFIKIRLHADKVTVVTSYYPPHDIDPAMAGFLIDNQADFRDITCLLPYWATRRIISMEEIPKGNKLFAPDLKLIKLKELPIGSYDYEHSFFNKIFNGKTEVLTSSFRGGIGEPIRLLSNQADKYYNQKKSSSRNLKLIVLGISWLWAFFGITFLPFIARNFINIDSSGFIIFIIINFLFFFLFFPFLFALIVNKIRNKNPEGKSLMPELLGFYEFIKMADLDRIKTLLKDDPYYFEKTMPYAVAFNLLKEWTANFEGFILNAPDWYKSNSGTPFKFNVFASSFSKNMSVARSSMVITPSSGSSSSSSHSRSGGGFSGGGGGAGGGGSW